MNEISYYFVKNSTACTGILSYNIDCIFKEFFLCNMNVSIYFCHCLTLKNSCCNLILKDFMTDFLIIMENQWLLHILAAQ